MPAPHSDLTPRKAAERLREQFGDLMPEMQVSGAMGTVVTFDPRDLVRAVTLLTARAWHEGERIGARDVREQAAAGRDVAKDL